MEDYFEGKHFDTIINCAAYTAVDKAESERELADTINHRFVSMLAKIAKRNNSKLIHISTDYVFDGKNHRPYIESDPTDPQGVYGRTKRDGENAILAVSLQPIRSSSVPHGSTHHLEITLLKQCYV